MQFEDTTTTTGSSQEKQVSNSQPRIKQLAKKSVRTSPMKSGGKIIPSITTIDVASHGGIIRPFKAPGRIAPKTPLDVQPVEGQRFTSLKNLQAAVQERKNSKGKKKA